VAKPVLNVDQRATLGLQKEHLTIDYIEMNAFLNSTPVSYPFTQQVDKFMVVGNKIIAAVKQVFQ